jgi:ribose transport system substrate-binding protein
MTRFQMTTATGLRLACAGLGASLALAACGSSGSTSATPSSHASSAGGRSGGISTAARAEAQKVIAPYVGHPGPFPVDAPLSKRPTGARIAMVDDGTPLIALFYQLMQPAAKELGVTLYRVKAGTTAQGVNAGFEAVAQQRPAAVINTAIDPNLWRSALHQLQAENVPIVSLGTVADQSLHLVEPNGGPSFENEGKLQAAWIVANAKAKPDVAYYSEPELAFAAAKQQEFVSEMHQLCPSCTVRTIKIPISTVNNTAPSAIVSDLQSHPQTNVISFSSTEVMGGLPTALRSAGLHVETVGANGTPATLTYLKNNEETVELAADLPVLAWTAMDAAARLITRQKLTQAEQNKTALVNQFLTSKDIADPAKGYTGYPDFAARFGRLWGVAK